MKVHEFSDAILYRLSCEDGEPDHDMSFEIEWDEEWQRVIFNFHKKLYWSAYWNTTTWYQNLWKKLKAIYRIVFYGYIKVEESLLIDKPEHIETFYDALKEGQKKLENLKATVH
jgi:hypothetical protein